jgi:hypothetical protein
MTSHSETEKKIARAAHDVRMNNKVRAELTDRVADKEITQKKAEKLYKQRTGKAW